VKRNEGEIQHMIPYFDTTPSSSNNNKTIKDPDRSTLEENQKREESEHQIRVDCKTSISISSSLKQS